MDEDFDFEALLEAAAKNAPQAPMEPMAESKSEVAAVAPPQAESPPEVTVEPDTDFGGIFEEDPSSEEDFDIIPNLFRSAGPPTSTPIEDGDDPLDFMANVTVERDVPNIVKPWMKHHKFVLVTTAEEVNRIVDEALVAGHISLDLETQGLDNRIIYVEGKPRTEHQIVGFCLSIDGITGYYIPVRHQLMDDGRDLNAPVAEVEAAIKRLCVASQPVGTPEAIASDPLSCSAFISPPKVVIDFWHAKFDQECLYPITGIDWWHPDSFEDGMLAFFCKFSADKNLSLKHKAAEQLRDVDGNPHVMIELKELFGKGRKIHFDRLAPTEPGVISYACSDAVNTRLLCASPRTHEKDRVDILKVVKEKYSFTYRLEKQTSQVGRVLERNRVRVRRPKVLELLKEQEAERDTILTKIKAFATERGFEPELEPSSPKQLSDFLFTDKKGCLNISPKPERNEASGQYKTNEDSLAALVKAGSSVPPVLSWILDYRGLEKMIGTYLQNLYHNPDKNDEIRVNFKQTGAATGRFTAPSGDPDQGFSGVPIHGIPHTSTLRKLFYARDGYTMAKCDFAGQELRIAANMSGEPVWIKEFLQGSGDLHSITARAFFNKPEVTKDERGMGKCVHPETIVFAPAPRTIGSLGFYPSGAETFAVTTGEIWSAEGKHKLKALYNGGIKPLVHVISTGGVVTCTKEHRFRLVSGELVRAGDLGVGAKLLCAPLPEYPDKVTTLTTEEAYSLGVLYDFPTSIPIGVFQRRDTMRSYLEGYLGIYGCRSEDKITSNTRSPIFAGHLALLLRILGLGYKLDLLECGWIQIQLSGAASTNLKKTMRNKLTWGAIPDVFEEDPVESFEVLGVIAKPEDHLCLDVSVDSDEHMYLANGFETHNTANFALIYGGGPQAIMRATGCNKLEGQRRKQAFDKAVPVFASFIKEQHAAVKKNLGVWSAFYRWLAIPDANSLDDAVKAACERHSVNYRIQSSGADIMKICMIKLHKKFHSMGWLKNGGSDAVRMLLTVHDELVFEIKHEIVVDAIPIIVNIMESPMPKSWKVPLIVEPLIGPNWGTGYPCERVKTPDQKAKPGEVILNGFVYGVSRKAEKDLPEEGEVAEGKMIRILDPAWLRGHLDGSAPAPTQTEEVKPPPQENTPRANLPVQETPKGGVILRLSCPLNAQNLKMVKRFCVENLDPTGTPVQLTDIFGMILVDVSLGIKVNFGAFMNELRKYNLVPDGSYALLN